MPQAAAAASFDDVAEIYDEVRPGYPEPVVERIVAFAGLCEAGRVLEVGCGTGKMTLPFARRGYAITALDTGAKLAAVAAQHCRPYPRTRVVVSAFEAFQHPPAGFDLVLSATAFHWIDPAYGLPRAAELLREGGAIALVWPLDRSQDSAFWKATQGIYARYNPGGSTGKRSQAETVDLFGRELACSPLFVDAEAAHHVWTARYAGAEYLKLLRTFSDHWAFPEAFFREIGAVVDAMGGEVVRTYETVVLLARKAPGKAPGKAGEERP